MRRAAVARLVRAGCVSAEDEADELLGGAPDEATLDVWLGRREQGEPLAWITGWTNFCGRRLQVLPGLYVPRPQTEELARRAAELLADRGRALDLCTGIGAVASELLAQVPTATVVGVDVDERAAACARRNGVAVIAADLAEPLHGPGGFDLVTAVAPYVPTGAIGLLPADTQRYEPRVALDGGVDGLDLMRRVVVAAGSLLRSGGWLLVELGGTQHDALAPTLAAAGFEPAEPWRDAAGDVRGLAARATSSSWALPQ